MFMWTPNEANSIQLIMSLTTFLSSPNIINPLSKIDSLIVIVDW
jgi:hypothetical protein